MVIDPEAHVETGALEFPTGWQLILASFQRFKLTRSEQEDEDEDEQRDDENKR